MKYLFSHEYDEIKVIGFDMDGTLYDEFDMVYQAYNEIANRCNNSKPILNQMILRWLEKGSSYPYIFKEVASLYNFGVEFEKQALSIYRNYVPSLMLSSRMRYILDKISEDGKRMFLLSDGKPILQNSKISSLGIASSFEMLIITDQFPKPSTHYCEDIESYFSAEPSEILYVGDRKVDEDFAEAAGYQFCYINQFI